MNVKINNWTIFRFTCYNVFNIFEGEVAEQELGVSAKC